MASSSSSSKRYDVFPSFSGEDVRKSFLSHLLKELHRRLIITFRDHGIERSRPISPELLSAIRESKISVVVFSKKYTSSTWCLNELVEIHKCYKELGQTVIPIFYEVDPSHVRKQTGEFGKAFETTCEGKSVYDKERWMHALTELASVAGEDSRKWCDEANMIETIANNISNQLITPSNDFGDFVGIEAHLRSLNSMLCLESEDVRIVGIVGPSGIGKTTIAGALFSQLSRQFHHRAFRAYKRTNPNDYIMKLYWEEQFLSDILCQKDIKLSHFGVVEQRLKHRKVLVVLDDVNELELLQTLVGKREWFGNGSRIIVVTQDMQILKSHDIDHIYEVPFPSREVALQMFSWSAFRLKCPPFGFLKLAVEVVYLAGNLPLGLNVLGSSLRGKDEDKWVKMMPRLRNGLNGKIEKTLRVCYDGLDEKDDQDLFLYIACLFNGHTAVYIENLLAESFDTNVNTGLRILADKSLIRITHNTIQMHLLLQKFGREIVRAESINNPGKRRFLLDAKDISDVFKDNTGTDNVLAIYYNTSEIKEPLSIDKKSFKRMHNLQFIKFYREEHTKFYTEEGTQKTHQVKLNLPQGLVYLPRKLRLLYWNEYPAKYIPSSFSAEHLVELRMVGSKLVNLWEGTQPLGNLKKINLVCSADLKEIPDLSTATNLDVLNLFGCTSLVTLPSSIRGLKKLRRLLLGSCSKLEVLPTDVNLESLQLLILKGCSRLRSFPRVSRNISELILDGTAVEEEDYFWMENICGLTSFVWSGCPLKRMSSNFHPEHLVSLEMPDSKLQKLWEGVKPLRNLLRMDLSGCEKLKEIPDLTMATKLERLDLNYCKSLVMLPSTIRNLNKLRRLYMKGCTSLQFLPTNVNLISLSYVDLSECVRLRSFPQISTNITDLFLDYTAIEEVPSWIENISRLSVLQMSGCKRLKNISPSIFKLRRLECADFSDCREVTSLNDASAIATATVAHITGDQVAVEDDFPRKQLYELQPSSKHTRSFFQFQNCFNLDLAARELIMRSSLQMPAAFAGGEVPTYFTHRACGNSLIITLPQSFLSHDLLIKACIVVGSVTNPREISCFAVSWCFRGVRETRHILSSGDLYKGDHLVVFQFDCGPLSKFRPPLHSSNHSLSDMDYNHMEFKFSLFDYLSRGRHTIQEIKECGIRIERDSISEW